MAMPQGNYTNKMSIVKRTYKPKKKFKVISNKK